MVCAIELIFNTLKNFALAAKSNNRTNATMVQAFRIEHHSPPDSSPPLLPSLGNAIHITS